MKQVGFKTFGQWLSSQMAAAKLSPDQLASSLRYPSAQSIKRLCDNQSRLEMKDWPTVAKLLQIRLDEFLIVLEYFHPDWVSEYEEFISNCLRYLLWRVEQNQQFPVPLPELLLSVTMNEIVEPACADRYVSIENRRKADRRMTKVEPERDNRSRPRRLTDLIHYLKNQIGLLTVISLFTSGATVLQGWVF
ncbi:MAG TPA: hypothetical protein VMN77_12065 [Nitrospiria bacterium]|jgi:hypothetical protein|nr:hypothetical protein [Nitrospiria bacterium]